MYNSLTVNEEGRSGRGGVIGVVSVHPLSVVDTRGVVTGVGVGVFVFEGFSRLCLLSPSAALLLFTWLVVGEVQIPGRWR